jgi:hypothetical protein
VGDGRAGSRRASTMVKHTSGSSGGSATNSSALHVTIGPARSDSRHRPDARAKGGAAAKRERRAQPKESSLGPRTSKTTWAWASGARS